MSSLFKYVGLFLRDGSTLKPALARARARPGWQKIMQTLCYRLSDGNDDGETNITLDARGFCHVQASKHHGEREKQRTLHANFHWENQHKDIC